MLRKLCQSFKKTQTAQADTPRFATTAKTTFFSLPAEIRNAIYELVAQDVVLELVPRPHSKSASDTIEVPSLLLTSRQSRQESMPILLSCARIKAPVIDFNFRRLTRVTSSLYSTELKALRANDKLVIQLAFWQPFDAEQLEAGLHHWAVNRSNSLDRLPWQYRVRAPRPYYAADGWSNGHWVSPPTAGQRKGGWRDLKHADLREGARYLGVVRSLRRKVEESIGWELERIEEALERRRDMYIIAC